jgi:hypothetical protein
MSYSVKPHITRLMKVRIRCIILIIYLIFGYNSYYIYFEVITKIPFLYKHSIFREYKFITFKDHIKTIFKQ